MGGIKLNKYQNKDILNMSIAELSRGKIRPFLYKFQNKLFEILRAKNIFIKPTVWCSTDWFTPDGEGGFAFPFYLLDDRLKEIYLNYFYDLDGENDNEIIKLFLHESSHVIDNTFGLRRQKKRQILFGKTSKVYPDFYTPDFNNDDYIENLGECYGQSHPDEDWAESFTSWLLGLGHQKLSSVAKEKYDYLASVMEQKVCNTKPVSKSVSYTENVLQIDQTFGEFIKKRKLYYQMEFFGRPDASGRSHLEIEGNSDISKEELLRVVGQRAKNKNFCKVVARNVFNSTVGLKNHKHEPIRSLSETITGELTGFDRILM